VELLIIDVAANFTSEGLEASSSLLEVGIDSFASVSFSRSLTSATGVSVTGRDLLKYSRIEDLATYIYNNVKTAGEDGSTPISAEMQIMVNMEPLTGLRGMVVMQVFWYHWHSTWPSDQWSWFGRCLDMETFFIIMGTTGMIQFRKKKFDNMQQIWAFYWSQAWKIFPMYWLALLFTYYSPLFEVINATQIYPADETIAVHGAFNFWFNTILNVAGLQTMTTNYRVQIWFHPVFWFMGTMWVLATLLFPPLLYLVRYIAPITADRTHTFGWLLGFIFVYWVFWAITNGMFDIMTAFSGPLEFATQSTPYWKIWIFISGMLIGQLLLGEARNADENLEKQLIDKISGKNWGYLTDFSGFLLAFLTFGPPHYNRASIGPLTWGYIEPVEIYLIMPLQLLTVSFFLYGVLHNRGMIVTVLNTKPMMAFGAVVYPFYLFHCQITELTLSGSYDAPNDGGFEPPYQDDNSNIGDWLPIGGIALTWVVSYLLNEYYMLAINLYMEPCMSHIVTYIGYACQTCWTLGCSFCVKDISLTPGGDAEDIEGGRSLLHDKDSSTKASPWVTEARSPTRYGGADKSSAVNQFQVSTFTTPGNNYYQGSASDDWERDNFFDSGQPSLDS